MTAKLFISPAEGQPGRYLVVVNGEGFNNSVGKSVAARIRGDDPFFDDRLFSIGVGGFHRVAFDGTFTLSQVVNRSQLNEDPEGRDEVYALVDVDGLNQSVRSNTIKRSF